MSRRRSGRWLRAFRCTDEFVMEALRDTARFEGKVAGVLALELHRCLVRCGAGLVAASVGGDERDTAGSLREVRLALAEASYRLNVARRLGWLPLNRYRALEVRHQGAVREVEALTSDIAESIPRARAPGTTSR